MDDLAATPASVATALGVSLSTVYRWLAEDSAPRVALLALFWVTRWGLSATDVEAFNLVQVHRGLTQALQDDNRKLRAELVTAGRLGDFGSANDPAPHIVTTQAYRSDPGDQRPQTDPAADRQPDSLAAVAHRHSAVRPQSR